MSDKPKAPETPPAKPDWALSGRERRNRARAEAGLPPRRRRWPWILLALIVVAGVAGYTLRDDISAAMMAAQDEPAPEETPAPQPAADPAETATMQLLPSELAEIAPTRLRETVKLTGTLTPARSLGIPAEVAGHVNAVTVRAGDSVEEGAVLVQIDIETLENQRDQQRATAEATRAQLSLARAQLERTQSLVDRGTSATSQLESAQAQVRQLEANLAAAETQVANAERSIERATITAPFAGVIAERSVDPGAYVNPGAALLTLVDIDTLTLEGIVPVLYGPLVEVGQIVEARVEGAPDRLFTGQVERVAPVAAQGSRMLPVYASIDNAEQVLKGGMFASGVLVLEEKADALAVPAEALREDTAGRYVLKREGDRVARQYVQVARSWDNGRLAEIADGLEPGDIVVAEPLEQLTDGMTIAVREE